MAETGETGAKDWRSDEEKAKARLRVGMMSLFKCWIPDHPEASTARAEVHPVLRDALGGAARITLVSSLFQGIDDLEVYELTDQPISLQDIMVDRQGSEAFLDPKMALRLVRRKFGLMTMITRMTGTLEHRNITAVSISAGIPMDELLRFSRLMSARITESAAEEEKLFRRALAREPCPHIDVLFHDDVIGRKLPVRWEVKQFFSTVARALRAGGDPVEVAHGIVGEQLRWLGPRQLMEIALHATRINIEMDTGRLDAPRMTLGEADEEPLLIATRHIFDEYKALKKEAERERAMSGFARTGQFTAAGQSPTEDGLPAEDTEALAEELEAEDDFLTVAEEAAGPGADDELVIHARALDLLRAVRGRGFFRKVSMVAGEIDFVGTAAGFGGTALAAKDPLEAHAEAKRITEPMYRARSLADVVGPLMSGGHLQQALEAGRDALEAARACNEQDAPQAFSAAIEALMFIGAESDREAAVREGLQASHRLREPETRAASLMRIASTLLEAGALPQGVRSTLSRNVMGDDIHFWDEKVIEPPLVEALVSLLPGVDDDTVLFLQTLIAHTDPGVRCGVVRTIPFTESEALRNMLLSHLKDAEEIVRTEVVERLGASQDPTLGIYLQNVARQKSGDLTEREKRAVALNLARLDLEKYTPLFNAMLGPLATATGDLTKREKPFKEDIDWQMAALEVLFHANSRSARRLLYNAALSSRGALKDSCERIWAYIKDKPYGEHTLPRSPHDPEWTEEDEFDLLRTLERVAPEAAEPDAEAGDSLDADHAGERAPSAPADDKKGGGLFGRLKSLFKRGDDAGESNEATDPAEASAEASVEQPVEPLGPPAAAMRIEARLSNEGEAWSGSTQMVFRLYVDEDGEQPLWEERLEQVPVEEGAINVRLGLSRRFPKPLPGRVWLGISVQDRPEMRPRALIERRAAVVEG